MAEFTMAIAGFSVGVCSLFASTKDYCKDYLTQEAPQFTLSVTEDELLAEQRFLDEEADQEGLRRRVFGKPFLERNFLQRRIAALLLPHGVLLLHGSAVALEGKGYLFTAACGTGKSTHTRLWRQEFAGAEAINDDKPFLRRTPQGWLLCGSPWMGKHGVGSNLTVPLAGICVLERGDEDRIEAISSHDQILAGLCSHQPDLVADLLANTPLWLLHCTPNPSAAHVAHAAMAQGNS